MHGGTNLRISDQVEIISGKDKGRVGKILKIHQNDKRVLVERINLIKRHTKPNMSNQSGGILEKEAPIHISNLMLICPKCAKTVRIGKICLDDGTKNRICKKCGESIDSKS